MDLDTLTTGSRSQSSMNTLVIAIFWMFVAGCSGTEQSREQEVRAAVEKAGGSSLILQESRKLFASLNKQNEEIPSLERGRWLDGLPGIKSLGSMFYYGPKNGDLPSRILIRRGNNHRDIYVIELINQEEIRNAGPKSFRRIVGNIGFIEPDPAANQSQTTGSQASQTPAAAGSGR